MPDMDRLNQLGNSLRGRCELILKWIGTYREGLPGIVFGATQHLYICLPITIRTPYIYVRR